jgi:predicted transcriptional regulator
LKDNDKQNAKSMDVEAHRDLRLLEAVHEDSRVTQRGMAKKLGIALGLANIYLKRMIHKGYIKCVNVQPNRISYLITPRGIAEKARLTYEFMDYSLHLYGEVRQHLREAMQDCAAAGKRVAIYGSGEAAELAYLSLKESGMEPVAIFDHDGGGVFLGMPVEPIADHGSVEYDLMIVATLDRSGQAAVDLQSVGVPRDKQFPLRKEPEPAPKSPSTKAAGEKRARAATVRSRSTNGKH